MRALVLMRAQGRRGLKGPADSVGNELINAAATWREAIRNEKAY